MENFGKQLHRLIKICDETRETYTKAADRTESLELKNKFMEIAERRQQLADQLTEVISGHSTVHPDEHSDIMSSLHRAWMNVKTSLSSTGERGILEKCRDGDQAALDAYDDVLQGEILFSDLRPLIISQRTAISTDFQEIDKKYFEYFPPAGKEL
ncbi:MAG TPA: PA2169 family four-helix-bundle protein [Sphingobacteriaceae bacterium]